MIKIEINWQKLTCRHYRTTWPLKYYNFISFELPWSELSWNLTNFTIQKIFLQSMSLLMHVHVGGEWWDLQGTPLKLYSSLLWWWTNFCFGKHENRKFLVQSLGGKNYGRYETFLNSKNIFNGESLSYLLAANEKNVSKEVHVKNFSLQLKYRLKVQHISHFGWVSEYQCENIVNTCNSAGLVEKNDDNLGATKT